MVRVFSPQQCMDRACRRQGFTLVELLAVMGMIVVLVALLAPAMQSLGTAKGIDQAAYTISETLEGARAHAIAHNTYVWVGFYEEDAGTTSPTVTSPPYSGKGRLVMGAVASLDGTTILNDSDSGTTTLPAASLTQIGKLVKIENVHLTDLGTPSGGTPESLDGRPNLAYSGSFPSQNRISSDNTESTRRPFTLQGYTFAKTIRFSPRGEAQINSTYQPRRVGEIGLRPTHGTAVDTATRNVVAVQFTGIAGNVRIYRR